MRFEAADFRTIVADWVHGSVRKSWFARKNDIRAILHPSSFGIETFDESVNLERVSEDCYLVEFTADWLARDPLR